MVAGLAAAVGGLAVVGVTAAELTWVGALDGPSFGAFPNAAVETGVFALLGAAAGFRFVTRPRPGSSSPADVHLDQDTTYQPRCGPVERDSRRSQPPREDRPRVGGGSLDARQTAVRGPRRVALGGAR